MYLHFIGVYFSDWWRVPKNSEQILFKNQKSKHKNIHMFAQRTQNEGDQLLVNLNHFIPEFDALFL